MSPVLRWLSARNLQMVLPCLLLFAAAALLIGDLSFPVNSPWAGEDRRRVPLLEVATVLMAALLGYGCRPTMWQSEHLSVRPLVWSCGGLAALLAGLPIGAVALAAYSIPTGTDSRAYISTVTALCGISLLIGPSVVPVLSWVAPLAVYLATIVVQVAWREWGEDWWPIADPRVDGDNRWVISIALLVVGVLIQSLTRGGTMTSGRRLTTEVS